MWRLALDVLLPRFCLGCRARLSALGAPLDLCRRCAGKLVALDPERACRGCSRPLAAGAITPPICGACLAQPPPWSGLQALWVYRAPLDAVIGGFKFHGLDYLGARLAQHALGARRTALEGFDRVVPMPIAPLSRLVRGFNQAERFARPLARGLGVPYDAVLRRSGLASGQVGRGRSQRLRLVALGAIRIRRGAQVEGRRILLVDDVVTTGATARAATGALLAAGAAGVEVLVVGWTPPLAPAGAGIRTATGRLDSH